MDAETFFGPGVGVEEEFTDVAYCFDCAAGEDDEGEGVEAVAG